jgi:peptide deformylase
MALPIAQLGQPVLRCEAREVPPDQISSPEFQAFVRAMRDTLEAAGGVGLAGPQVFADVRVFLARVAAPGSEGEPAPVEVFINPRLFAASEEEVSRWEGCLSFPELLVLVPRARQVRLEYLDESGQPQQRELADFPARVVQHEYDHLDGILTIDRAASTLHIIKASEADSVLGGSRSAVIKPEETAEE